METGFITFLPSFQQVGSSLARPSWLQRVVDQWSVFTEWQLASSVLQLAFQFASRRQCPSFQWWVQ